MPEFSHKLMLGLPSGQLLLSPYEPAWSQLFLAEQKQLVASLGHTVLDIQHIGSTSIPGMPAKPILDIGVAVSTFEQAAVCIPLLKQLGYSYKGENGIARRHYFVKGNPRTHHLHLLEKTSQEWKNHLLFRDYLCANAEVAQAYANLKQQLATQFVSDREAYQTGKEKFIQAVLQQANEAR